MYGPLMTEEPGTWKVLWSTCLGNKRADTGGPNGKCLGRRVLATEGQEYQIGLGESNKMAEASMLPNHKCFPSTLNKRKV